MQVDRQPSPWPSVAMLAGLLLFCLLAPRLWWPNVTSEDAAIGAAADLGDSVAERVNIVVPDAGISIKSNFAVPAFNFGDADLGRLGGAANGDLFYLWGPPTIEELIAKHALAAQLAAHDGRRSSESFEWPVLVRAATGGEAGPSPSGPPLVVANPLSPEATAAMESVGALWAEHTLVNSVPRFATWIAEGYPRLLAAWAERGATLASTAAEAAPPSPEAQTAEVPSTAVPSLGLAGRSSVRVLGANDRLAMLPAPRDLEVSHPWCVPQVLFEMLDRLANQADSAQWASHVRNQLHVLTDRETLQGDDVQTILGDLGESAEEASRMADRTSNDRLRVELLRAHWALARRLDCWGAMHEKRVAVHFQGRLAARGPLQPYLGGSPDGESAAADITELSKELETYETSRDPKLGRCVAQQQQSLKASADSADRTLADAVEQHYRNANIRVAITAEMLNRLVDERRMESKAVHDQIAGTFVRGRSDVRSESRVLLDPSADEWQLELSTNGVVESNTLADGGPVRFRSRGTTGFSAHRKIVVDDKGVQFKRSDVAAMCRNRLVGVTTDYDWVPLFGSYARERAVEEYRAKQGRVKSQVEFRVASQARQTLNQQTREAVDKIRQQTYDRVASQLDEFGINLTPVEMKTTPERLVARVRVAGEKQLGSHTPRPRALSDSLARRRSTKRR